MEQHKIVENWIQNRLVTWSDKKDGYTWTVRAKKLVPYTVRSILAGLSNGMPVKYQHQIAKLKQYGFDKKGFYCGKA